MSGATAALLEVLIPELLQLGIQEAPVIQALIASQAKLQQANRPDISDADFAALRSVITALQARIDAA